MPETALGEVDRMIVFNNLQADPLFKQQETSLGRLDRRAYGVSGLLKLEETHSHSFDYSTALKHSNGLKPRPQRTGPTSLRTADPPILSGPDR